MGNQNKETEYCTQCPRQCPKDQLSCGRGRAFFGMEERGETTERYSHGEHGGREEHSSHGGHGRHGEHGGHGKNGGCHGAEYGKELEKIKPEEQTLSQLLNRCGYIAAKKGGHQHTDQNREAMFDVLDIEEQKILRNMLERLLNQWMSERGKGKEFKE